MVDSFKMSKSVGNVTDPMSLQDKYTSVGLRYFLPREGVLSHDGSKIQYDTVFSSLCTFSLAYLAVSVNDTLHS